ncbi:MAG: thrombospondin type 3 repeat-containing protein, partial [Chromatiales bacterium]
TETTDTDGDGVGNNSDAFPTDPTETTDTDGDGVGDNSDAFPSGDDESQETDGDGVGDNCDAFPTDPNENTDTDGDSVGDNSDAFPTDPTETTDTDGDGVGDNGDAFPTDPDEIVDTDGDGVGDNGDAFPVDPNESVDTDGDGLGDNADPDDDNNGVPDVEEPRADLAIAATIAPQQLTVGQPDELLVTVENYGPFFSTGTKVVIDLPAMVQIGDASGDGQCLRAGSQVICKYVDMQAGGSVSTKLRMTPQMPGTLGITAVATGDEVDDDPVNNTVSLSREVMEEVIVTANRSGGGGGGSIDPLWLLLLVWLLYRQYRVTTGGEKRRLPLSVRSASSGSRRRRGRD